MRGHATKTASDDRPEQWTVRHFLVLSRKKQRRTSAFERFPIFFRNEVHPSGGSRKFLFSLVFYFSLAGWNLVPSMCDVRLLLAIAYGIISAGAWAVIMSEPWSTSVRWHAHNVWNMLLSLHSFQFSTYFLGQAQAQAEPVRQADNPTKSMTTFFLLSRNCNKRNYNSYSYIAVHVCGSECVCADMYVRLWYK